MSSSSFQWKSIPDLEIAVSHFGIRWAESKYPKLINLKRRDKVFANLRSLDRKYFEQDFSAQESGFGYRVKKQEGARFNYRTKEENEEHQQPISIVLSEEFQNGLGMDDFFYYFIIYRKKISNTWGKSLNLTKFERHPGFYIPFDILKYIEDNKVQEQSYLVVVLQDTDIYKQGAKTASEFTMKNDFPVFLDSRGVLTTGLPLDGFEKLG
jgi:hypothetical protein